jgi:hypothetical protein
MAPIPRPGKIVGVGYNYLDHIREQGLERPARPVLFSMFANAVAADGDPIRHPAGTHALDLEAELAVVIGRRASRVAAADALDTSPATPPRTTSPPATGRVRPARSAPARRATGSGSGQRVRTRSCRWARAGHRR